VLNEVARTGAKHKAMYRSANEAAKAPAGTRLSLQISPRRKHLRPALRDVDAVYLVCSPIPDLVQLETNMIDACVIAGVKHVVLNSALGAGEYSKSYPSWHRKVEDKLKSTEISFTILQPNSFHQNVVAFFAPCIRAQGVFYSSMRDARVSFLDVRDIAVVAAKALAGGDHSGKTYELNGPEALTYAELAEKIAEHAGRTVQYVDIPVDAQRKANAGARHARVAGRCTLDLQEYYTSGKGGNVDQLLPKLLGRAPISMDRFLAEFAGEFHNQAAGA